MDFTYEEIKARLNNPKGVSKPDALDQFAKPIVVKDPTVVRNITYDVPMDAIYDRLSDGTYIKKYENYLGAVGNEDRLGRLQSTGEQWRHGLAKAGVKTLNYALDATVGTIYGIGQAIDGGKFEKFWDNDFSNKLDDWNKSLDNSLANYYTDEQKSMSVLEKLGTANFWANDFAGGLAFVGGALLPELALGALTGGATIAGGLAKIGFKAGLKSAAKRAGKEAISEAFDPTNYVSKAKGAFGKSTFNSVKAAEDLKALEGGLDLLKASNKAKYYSTAGQIADTGLFLTRTSAFEAGMEARHNFKESIQTYIDNYIEKNGDAPSAAELQDFTQKAASAGNKVFGANMAILSVSNAAMFGKAFNIKGIQKLGQRLEGLENRIMGIGTKTEMVDGVLRTTVNQATRGQKIVGNAYKILSKPAVEGLYEEGFQGVAGKTMQKYLENKYSKGNEAYSFSTALGESFNEQYTTTEGWTEMVVGMLIGGLSGVFTNPISNATAKLSGQEASAPGLLGSIPGFGKNSRKAAQVAMQEKADEVNKGVDMLRSMNRASSAKSFRDQLDSNNDATTMGIDETLLNREFIKSQDSLKTPEQMIEDFSTVIDHADFTENGVADIVGTDNIDAYKTKLKNDFKTSVANHKKAKATVEALNLGKRLNVDGIGNQIEVEDYVETMLYLGYDAKDKARSAGEELDTLVGVSGLYDAMEFFNGIDTESKAKVVELNKKKAELGRAKKLAQKYGLELTGLRETRRTTKQSETKYNQTAEKAALAAEQVLKLEAEKTELEDLLKSKVDPTVMSTPGYNISDILDKVEELDKYEKTLRKAGRTTEANALAYKVQQYKTYSDLTRESSTFFSRMADQDFFSSKEGQAFTSKVIGSKYTMSKELKDLLEQNGAIVDKALFDQGFQFTDRTEAVKAMIENNPQLSEREKEKIASIYRIVLTAQNLNRIKEEIQDGIVRMSAEETSGIEGDSIEVAEKVINQEDLNNLKLLNEAIDKIVSQVEFIRGNSKAAEQVEKLEKQLDELRQQRAELVAQQTSQGNATVVTPTNTAPQNSREAQKDALKTKYKLSIVDKGNGFHLQRGGKTFSIFNTLQEAEAVLDERLNSLVDNIIEQPIDLGDNISIDGITVDGTTYSVLNVSQRMVTVVNIGGVQVPFYLTTGLGGKNLTPSWYPMFGYSPSGWLNKTNGTDMEAYYERLIGKEAAEVLKATAEKLNKQFGTEPNSIKETGIISGDQTQQAVNSTLKFTPAENQKIDASVDADAELARLESNIQSIGEEINNNYNPQQDATKESTQQEENSNEQSSSSQYQGTNTGQQTTGQTEGSQRETTEQSSDSSNSTIASQIQEIDQKIAETLEKIQNLKNNKFKIIESEDWIRFNELAQRTSLTPQERDEFDELKDEIDNWTLITGVVRDGFRLSDLIIQKNILENTPIVETNEPTEVTVEETISDLDLGDVSRGNNANYTLGYYSVQAFRDKKTGLISVSGITPDALFEEMGVNYAKESDTQYKVVIDGVAHTVLVNDKKHVMFTDDAIEDINTKTNVSIAPTNKDIPTGYSIIYKFPGDTNEGEVLKSDYQQSFAEPHLPEDVYAMNSGDEVFFVIDPNDSKNKELLAPYRTTPEPIDVDAIDAQIVSMYEQKLASDQKLIDIEAKRSEVEADLSLATRPSDRSKLSRRIEALKKQLEKRKDTLLTESRKDVEKINKQAARAAKTKKDGKQLRDQIVIHVVDKDGNRLQILKGGRDGATTADKQLQALREMVASDEDLILRLANIPNPVDLKLTGAKVEKVLLGHPNLNVIKNDDGTHSIVYKTVTNNKNIVDIGYIEDGELKLRGSKDGVSEYYIQKFYKKSGRIPVVVFEMHGRKIAYPARVSESEQRDHAEFSKIYNANTTDAQKVKSLNIYLANNGIDIKEKGNAFILAGASNLNDEFFNNKLAQLNNLKYFYNLDEWLDPKSDFKSILETQVMVNINLSDPIHSPKLKIDFTGLPLNVAVQVQNNTNVNASKLFGISAKGSAATSAKTNAKNNQQKPC